MTRSNRGRGIVTRTRTPVWVALGIAILAASCNGDQAAETMSVHALLEDPTYGDLATIEGTTDLVGKLFCPCFELSSGGGMVVVWYDLAVRSGEALPGIDIGGISNGDTVQVTGYLREEPAPTGSAPEFLVTSIAKVADASTAGLPNPASVYCEEHGGTVDIRSDVRGERGVCIFRDGSECDEWAFFHGRCQPATGAPSR